MPSSFAVSRKRMGPTSAGSTASAAVVGCLCSFSCSVSPDAPPCCCSLASPRPRLPSRFFQRCSCTSLGTARYLFVLSDSGLMPASSAIMSVAPNGTLLNILMLRCAQRTLSASSSYFFALALETDSLSPGARISTLSACVCCPTSNSGSELARADTFWPPSSVSSPPADDSTRWPPIQSSSVFSLRPPWVRLTSLRGSSAMVTRTTSL